jgi:methionyl-tRNA formyltransferase
MKLIPSEVKTLAQAHGLPVFQPQTFKDDAVYETLKALECVNNVDVKYLITD